MNRKRILCLLIMMIVSLVLNMFTFISWGGTVKNVKGADKASETTDMATTGVNADPVKVADDKTAEKAEIAATGVNEDPTPEIGTSTEETTEKKSFAEKVADKLSGLPDEIVCFVISMVPIIELRGGLIVAAIKEIPLFEACAICIAGNLVPIPFILLLITPIFTWLKKTKFFKPIVEKLEKKSMGKSEKIQKYQFLGLVLFVGIPLPGTGAWTGSLIASLLNIKIKKAFPAICLGLLMATVIMCIISYGIPWLIANVF